MLWPLAIAIGFYGLIEDTLFKVFGGSSKRFTMNGKLLAENVSMSEKARERERESARNGDGNEEIALKLKDFGCMIWLDTLWPNYKRHTSERSGVR